MFEPLESRQLLSVQLAVAGTYNPGQGAGSAEIVAHDPRTQRLFVVNAVQRSISVLDAADPAHPTLVQTIDVAPLGVPNSVDVSDGVLAVAVENGADKTLPGKVAFYKTANGQFLSAVPVGALPDMLTFSPDGAKVLVANEGEPTGYNHPDSKDPEGSVSIIDVRQGMGHYKKLTAADVTTADFRAFNASAAALRAAGVRIFGPNATVAQDLEPEYITVSADSKTAWVTLQENNAIAIVDIATGKITSVVPLGYKDHSLPANALDAGERDGAINIVPRPVLGMYQPDSIASYQIAGQTYLVTANEGDAREWGDYVEATRISATTKLDPVAFPDAAALKTNANIGRLNITTAQGRFESDADDEYEQLYTFGARSFSIRSAAGALVFDSGDQLERITAAAYPTYFNASNDNTTFDNRSDDKGPEPEGVALGVVDGRTYAFIGLERIGGVVVFDVTDPIAPTFVQYLNNRDFATNTGDAGPEGLTFIPAAESPTGVPLLAVANEISGTLTLYTIDTVPATPVRAESNAVVLPAASLTAAGDGHADDNDAIFGRDASPLA